jgi:hypothetical protein
MLMRLVRAVDLLGYHDSLVIVRRRNAARVRAGAQLDVASMQLDEHLNRICGMTVAEHAATGARVIPLASIAGVRITGELRLVTYLRLHDGSTVKLTRDRHRRVTRDMMVGFFTELLDDRPAAVQTSRVPQPTATQQQALRPGFSSDCADRL